MKNSNNKGGNALLTIAPVAASPTNDAEFVDCVGLQTRFGIKRSLAYALLAEGAIKGVSLRRRGQIRGKRLFEVDSIRRFIHKQMQAAPIHQRPETLQ